jgi:hypothetical protein
MRLIIKPVIKYSVDLFVGHSAKCYAFVPSCVKESLVLYSNRNHVFLTVRWRCISDRIITVIYLKKKQPSTRTSRLGRSKGTFYPVKIAIGLPRKALKVSNGYAWNLWMRLRSMESITPGVCGSESDRSSEGRPGPRWKTRRGST